MLEKIEKYTAVDMSENGNVSIRLTTVITDNEIEISRSHLRQLYTPADSIDHLPEHISGSIALYRSGISS